MSDSVPPKHYTREPWRVVLIAAVAVGFMPLWKHSEVQNANTTGLSLPILMLTFAVVGAAAATLLLARSHIRSVFWAGVALWGGMVLVAGLIAWASLIFKFP